MSTLFIVGIDTDIGKTVVASIVCKALEADYWKPVQSGASSDSDTQSVRRLVGETSASFHPEAVVLQAPLSPHTAAEKEGLQLDVRHIVRPKTRNTLVIEGAGGLLVPINNNHTIADLIEPTDKVVLVSKHYLGSINHSLLSIHYLNQRGIVPGIVFNGAMNESSESAILALGKSVLIGRVEEAEGEPTAQFVEEQAKQLREPLKEWVAKSEI